MHASSRLGLAYKAAHAQPMVQPTVPCAFLPQSCRDNGEDAARSGVVVPLQRCPLWEGHPRRHPVVQEGVHLHAVGIQGTVEAPQWRYKAHHAYSIQPSLTHTKSPPCAHRLQGCILPILRRIHQFCKLLLLSLHRCHGAIGC